MKTTKIYEENIYRTSAISSISLVSFVTSAFITSIKVETRGVHVTSETGVSKTFVMIYKERGRNYSGFYGEKIKTLECIKFH